MDDVVDENNLMQHDLCLFRELMNDEQRELFKQELSRKSTFFQRVFKGEPVMRWVRKLGIKVLFHRRLSKKRSILRHVDGCYTIFLNPKLRKEEILNELYCGLGAFFVDKELFFNRTTKRSVIELSNDVFSLRGYHI